jgi:hypothetical protein
VAEWGMNAHEPVATPMPDARLDLWLAGVRWEVPELTERAVWQHVGQPAVVVQAEKVLIHQEDGAVAGRVSVVEASLPEVTVPVPEAVGWTAGEPGGVTVVVGAEAPLDGEALVLLGRMLAAISVDASKLWQVGAGGAELLARVQAGAGERALVLGQQAVATLWPELAQAGVEGWARKPLDWEGFLVENGRIGVTYPPGFLLQQPQFKQLAWRHLCAWRAAMERG